MKSIFNCDSYRDYMTQVLAGDGLRGRLSRAAESLGCQTSFLSRVLNGELHLTPDHAFNLAKHLHLEGDNFEYFLKLVEYERSGNSAYKKYLKAQLDELKKANLEIAVITNRKNINFEGSSAAYFSSWMYAAVHFLTTIKEFQTISSISQRLHIPTELTERILSQLLQMNFVEKMNQRWTYKGGEFHLERGEPFLQLHHQNWRNHAIIENSLNINDSIHYTTVLTLSKKDWQHLRQIIFSKIAEINKIAGPSNSEEVYNLNIDFYQV